MCEGESLVLIAASEFNHKFVLSTPPLALAAILFTINRAPPLFGSRCFFFKPEHERDSHRMKSFRNQPQTPLPGTRKEVQLFNRTCEKVGLSETQRQHLLTKVFFDPHAVEYWVEMHKKDAVKAERFLVSMAPPRGLETATMPVSRAPRWLASLARAVGLLS